MHKNPVPALLGAASLLASASLVCADTSTGKVSIADFTLGQDAMNAPSAKLQISSTGDMDFDDINGGFSYDRLLLETPLGGMIHVNDCNAVGVGLRYEATWLDTDTRLGNMDLHDLRLSFTWLHHQQGSKWSWLMSLSPGVSSDFNGVDGDDFSLNGRLGFRYALNSKFSIVGGVGVDNTTGDHSLYPAIGFQWRPVDDVHIALLGATFTATWQPHNDWLVRFGVWPGGGVWNVEENGNSFDVSMRSYNAAIGVERRLTDKVWLSLWAGTNLANNLEIETASGGDIFDEGADGAWFVNLGLRVAAW
ncbi:DUF6268 family outer membrane beta-barrel protein [Oceaniferula spumae]